MHRDFKLENILVHGETNAKTSPPRIELCDFGLAGRLTAKNNFLLHDSCGTPGYMAPEVIISKQGYDCKADIFSVGVILYILYIIFFIYNFNIIFFI